MESTLQAALSWRVETLHDNVVLAFLDTGTSRKQLLDPWSSDKSDYAELSGNVKSDHRLSGKE
jgi:hypothetical protein